MKKKLCSIIVFLLVFGLGINVLAMSTQPDEYEVTFQLVEIPDYTPEDAEIYIVGSMNDWEPGKEDYKMNKNEDGNYEITLTFNKEEEIYYKFTRGDTWYNEERDEDGNAPDDRFYKVEEDGKIIEDEVLHWSDMMLDHIPRENRTLEGNIEVIDGFEIPQLDRERNIWVYLPPDYEESNKEYPVLYMHDGQNVFDEVTAYGDEWQVDETLENLFAEGETDGVIVVAIDNNPDYRMTEYIAWTTTEDETMHMPEINNPEGDQYLEFIVETLKPYIDDNYRTLSDRENTGLAGSSAGGFISLYGGLKYQDVFSKIAAFSYVPIVFDHYDGNLFEDYPKSEDMRIYLHTAENDFGNEILDNLIIENVEKNYNELLDAGFSEDEVEKSIQEDAEHDEVYWAEEFPEAFLWLYEN